MIFYKIGIIKIKYFLSATTRLLVILVGVLLAKFIKSSIKYQEKPLHSRSLIFNSFFRKILTQK